MQGDYPVPTVFNGNFDAIKERNIIQPIPGWSFHNGANVTLQTDLSEWNSISTLTSQYKNGVGYNPNQPNYALKLEANQSITHNRLVVPEWGNLRFDVHAPKYSGILRVRLKTTTGQFLAEDFIDLSQDANAGNLILPGEGNLAKIKQFYEDNISKIGIGRNGFETFQLNLQLDNASIGRGQPAILEFELGGGEYVYIDNVFFKSVHLKWGNPTEARWDSNPPDLNVNPYTTNLLLEKPQYAVSYNADTKLPNWVSWQLDSSWRNLQGDRTNIQFITDPALPNSWPQVNGTMYSLTGLDKGHLLPDQDKNRHIKDAIATYLSTNLIPQAIDNNRLFPNPNDPYDPGSLDIDISPAWAKIESRLVRSLVTYYNHQLYITAGVLKTPENNWSTYNGQPETNAAEMIPTNPGEVFTTKFQINKIRIPSWTWKTYLAVDKPDRGVEDILGSYTYITPNIAEPYANWNGQSYPHPLNALVGGNRDPITSTEQWRNPQTWRVSLTELENALNAQGLGFTSG